MPRHGRPKKPRLQQICYFWFGNSMVTLHSVITYFRCFLWNARRDFFKGVYRMETPRHAFGGATLAHHLQATQRNPQLFHTGGSFPWVLIQEQSIIPSVPNYRPASVAAAVGLKQFCDRQPWDTQVIFLMTWGRRGGYKGHGVHYRDFVSHNRAIYQGYRQYIDATSKPGSKRSFLAPAGLVFETIYNDCLKSSESNGRDPATYNSLFFRLFGNDGYHQSGLGAYVVGLTVATTMTGFHPLRQRYDADGLAVEDMNAIKDAVARTILATFESGEIVYPWTESWRGTTAGSAPVPRAVADNQQSACAAVPKMEEKDDDKEQSTCQQQQPQQA